MGTNVFGNGNELNDATCDAISSKKNTIQCIQSTSQSLDGGNYGM